MEGKRPKTVGWYQEVLDLFLRRLTGNAHGLARLMARLLLGSVTGLSA
jgi:hypothetical protein